MTIQECIQNVFGSMKMVRPDESAEPMENGGMRGKQKKNTSPTNEEKHPPLSSFYYQPVSDTGTGFCRVFQLDGYAAVVLADVTFFRDIRIFLPDLQFKYISYYFSVNARLETPLLSVKETCQENQAVSIAAHTLYTNDGLPPEASTVFSANHRTRGLIVLFSPEGYISYLEKRFSRTITQDAHNIHLLNGLKNMPEMSVIYHQILAFQGDDFAEQLFIESKFNELITLYLKKALADCKPVMNEKRTQIKLEDQQYIQQVIEYIEEHYAETISLPEMAKKANMSLAKLKYCFKEITGTSVSVYQNRLRMKRAKKLLFTTNLPVNDIATRTGYQNSSSFSTAFKKSEGISPSMYRELFISS